MGPQYFIHDVTNTTTYWRWYRHGQVATLRHKSANLPSRCPRVKSTKHKIFHISSCQTVTYCLCDSCILICLLCPAPHPQGNASVANHPFSLMTGSWARTWLVAAGHYNSQLIFICICMYMMYVYGWMDGRILLDSGNILNLYHAKVPSLLPVNNKSPVYYQDI